MNRILAGVTNARQMIESKGLDLAKLVTLAQTLDMEFTEYARFQELKSSMMGDVLTLEEANTIYGYLGNTVEHFNRQPLEVKIVMTQIFKDLLGIRMGKAV
jgi:methyl coenzyme M reductase gamma subunit